MILENQLIIDNIIIPDILVNYNVKINPFYFLVKEESKIWFLSYKFVNVKKEYKYIKQDFTLFVSLTYPDCDKEKLRILSDFYYWLWIIDDKSELYETNIVEMEKFFDKAIDKNNNDKYSTSLYNIIDRMKLTKQMKSEFMNEINKYIKGTINRANKVFDNNITVEDYILARRENSAVSMAFLHIKYCLNINILEYKKEFKKLLLLFDDYISLSNDILSFKKEYIEGDMNIIMIIYKYYNFSLQKSIDHTYKMLNNILNDFNKISDKLSNENKELENVILGMKYWISGYLIWTKNSPRYN